MTPMMSLLSCAVGTAGYGDGHILAFEPGFCIKLDLQESRLRLRVRVPWSRRVHVFSGDCSVCIRPLAANDCRYRGGPCLRPHQETTVYSSFIAARTTDNSDAIINLDAKLIGPDIRTI
jgi:hypothetical protein